MRITPARLVSVGVIAPGSDNKVFFIQRYYHRAAGYLSIYIPGKTVLCKIKQFSKLVYGKRTGSAGYGDIIKIGPVDLDAG